MYNFDFDKEIEKQRIEYDLQEAEILHYCEYCGSEIYEGNEYFVWYTDEILCENCFDKKQEKEKRDCKRIAGEDDE